MTNIFVLIGAKHSGKTTIANAVKLRKTNSVVLESSADLKQTTLDLLNVKNITLEMLEANKDVVGFIPSRPHITWRELIIACDTTCKALHGELIWINKSISSIIRLSTIYDNIIFTGSGFPYEVEVLKSVARDLRFKLHCVVVKRDGKTYTGDSRIDISSMFKNVHTINNNSSIEDAVSNFENFIGKCNVKH